MTELITSGVNIGKSKYKFGLPGSKSYKNKTPSKLKLAGEAFIVIGSLIGIFCARHDIPLMIEIGSASALCGRFLVKCVSVSD